MVSLTKLVKTIVYTALLSKAVRGTLTYTLMRSLGRILRPSTILTIGAFIAALLNQGKSADRHAGKPKNFQTLLEDAFVSMLLKSTKGSGVRFTEAEATSTISAILNTLMRSVEGFSIEGRQGNKNRVIESNDYKVVYEK
ncbi:MAG: hypothetical protein ACE14P_12475 [Methanotrichaceae archaeon]